MATRRRNFSFKLFQTHGSYNVIGSLISWDKSVQFPSHVGSPIWFSFRWQQYWTEWLHIRDLPIPHFSLKLTVSPLSFDAWCKMASPLPWSQPWGFNLKSFSRHCVGMVHVWRRQKLWNLNANKSQVNIDSWVLQWFVNRLNFGEWLSARTARSPCWAAVVLCGLFWRCAH